MIFLARYFNLRKKRHINKIVSESKLHGVMLMTRILLQQSERYFHTAVSTENYMLVLGGRTSVKGYDNSVLAYRYKCNHWTNLSPGGIFNAFLYVKVLT